MLVMSLMRAINENKWLIQGKNNEYRSNFIGRALSQFSIDNAIIEDKKLKIISCNPDNTYYLPD